MRKILFVYDQNGWVWDFMSRGLIDYLPKSWTGERTNIYSRFGLHPVGYEAVFYWSVNLLWLSVHDGSESGTSDVPSYPKCVDMKKLSELKKYNKVLVGEYGSENTLGRMRWAADASVDRMFLICSKYYKLAERIHTKHIDGFELLNPATDPKMFFPAPIPHNKFTVGWAGHAGWTFKRTHLLQKLDYPVKMATDWGTKFFVKDRPHSYMNNFYNSVDAYVCVSYQEGIPQPILEAASCGLPIVSTDCGGISDFLDEEFLIQPYPENKMLREMNGKLKMLVDNPSLRAEIGAKNREKILREWNWSNRAKQLIKSIEEIKKYG